MLRACSVNNCGKPIHNVRGWCKMHYTRWNRHGDPEYSSRQDERKPIYEDGYALLPINKEQTVFTLVDSDSPATHYNWSLSGKYVYRQQDKRRIALHRYVMDADKYPDLEVDHINRNPLDNRTSNLRLVTRSINATNRVMSNNKSGVRGVIWDISRRRWQAFGAINKVRKTLYSGPDIEKAIQKRKEWEYKNGIASV